MSSSLEANRSSSFVCTSNCTFDRRLQRRESTTIRISQMRTPVTTRNTMKAVKSPISLSMCCTCSSLGSLVP